MERAQLLWNVRNSYETCATSMIYISSQTLQKALNDTIPIYTYIYRESIPSLYTISSQYVPLYLIITRH
jgi:hypothetical protein